MNKFYQFECGCKFPVLETDDEFPHIDFIADIEHISLECTKTWDLISEGNTKGC